MNRTFRGVLVTSALMLSPAASAGAASYDAHTVIVKWHPGVTLTDRLATQKRAGVQHTLTTIHGIGSKVVRVSGDPAQVAARLSASRLVDYAEVNRIRRVDATPDDPRFGELYGLHNIGQQPLLKHRGLVDADIDAPEGWDAAGMGSFTSTGGALVAVVDTGVMDTHEDLVGRVRRCATSHLALEYSSGSTLHETPCADEHSHGTHVSGTIGANADNGTGVVGVAFNSPLIVCKALHGPAGTGTDHDVASCITWAHDKGAKVINMSLGGAYSETQARAVAYAWENGGPNGSLLVATAGNGNSDAPRWPASHEEVVSVAATDSRDERAIYSNYNQDVEISAPGDEILSTVPAAYATKSGTSMAAPHVSGVAAVLWTLHPGETAAQIRARLTAAVDDLGVPGRDPEFGFGRVNLLKAVTG